MHMDAIEHEPTNMSDRPMELILVELKQNATKFATEH